MGTIELPGAAAVVAEIMKRNTTESGFALAVARGLIAALPTQDAVILVKYPQPIDPAALIG
jgi:hypothetical protein